MAENRIFLIGGPARCGKSTLAKMVRREIDGQVLSGDSFNGSIVKSLDVSAAPDIFIDDVEKPSLIKHTHEEFIARLRRRDKVSWSFYRNYIEHAYRTSKDDILMDANLWPDYLPELKLVHSAVFMVDTSDNRADWARYIRDNVGDNENNWMRDRGYTDEKIELWAKFDVARARRIIELCKKYNYPYFDLAEHGISRAQELAKDYLLKG